jgi:hypothetical protein
MTGAGDDLRADEVLRQLRPPAVSDFLEPGENPHADQLLQRIISSGVGARRPSRRLRLVVAVAAGTAAIGATAAAAVVLTRQAGNPTVLACYSNADVDTANQVAIEPDPARTPVEQCTPLWSDGRLGTGEAPPLVACVTDADTVAVLPGDHSACANAGWVSADTSPEANSDPSVLLPSLLSDTFAGRCMNVAAATAAAQDVLDQLGLAGWTIRDRATAATCTVPVVDVDARAIDLVSLTR